jgi:predicted dehydrogenase
MVLSCIYNISGGFHAKIEHFFECVMQDQEPLITGEDGRRSVEVMLAAEQSIAEDRIVALPL